MMKFMLGEMAANPSLSSQYASSITEETGFEI
jgi:hypothetical protein